VAARLIEVNALGHSDVGNELPACETVLEIIGDLFAHGRQLKHLVFDDRIVSLLGKSPILGRFVPEIVNPFHDVQSDEPRIVTANAWRKKRLRLPKTRKISNRPGPGEINGGRMAHRRSGGTLHRGADQRA
jgi:hypothetical protein